MLTIDDETTKVCAVSVPPTTTLPLKFPFANVGESPSPKPRTDR